MPTSYRLGLTLAVQRVYCPAMTVSSAVFVQQQQAHVAAQPATVLCWNWTMRHIFRWWNCCKLAGVPGECHVAVQPTGWCWLCLAVGGVVINKCCWSEVLLWATWTKVYSGQATHISSAEVAACKQTSVDCCITAKFIPIIGFSTPLQKNWTCQHPNKHTVSHTAVKVPINPSPPSPPSQSWLLIPPSLPAPSASCSQFHWYSHFCRLLPLKLMIPSKRRLDLKKINIHTSCALFVSTCSKLLSEAT